MPTIYSEGYSAIWEMWDKAATASIVVAIEALILPTKYIPFLPLDLDCTRSTSLEPLHLCYEMNCVVTSNVALTRTIEATDFMPPGLRAAV